MPLTRRSVTALYVSFAIFFLFLLFFFAPSPYDSVENTPGIVLLGGLVFYWLALGAYLFNVGLSLAFACRIVKNPTKHSYFGVTFLVFDLGFIVYILTH
jgi:hypothetical protein